MFLLHQPTHRMLVRYHPSIGHLYVPNLKARLPNDTGGYMVVANNLGFRSDLEFVKESTGAPRILMFGDSYTAGDNCVNADRYSDQLAGLLGAEVYNYGVSGTGTDQHLLIAQEFARDVERDLIVICVQIDSMRRIQVSHRESIDRLTGQRVLVPKPYFTLEGETLALHNQPVPRERPVVGSTETESPSEPEEAGWREAALRFYRQEPRFQPIRRFVRDNLPRVKSELFKFSQAEPYPDFKSKDSPGWQLMRRILEEFIQTVAPTPVLIVPIPTFEYYLHGLKPTYQEFFEALADPARGVHVLDVSNPLIQEPWEVRQRYTFRMGGHFTPFANRKVAELMADFIQTRKLLPAAGKPVAQAVPARHAPVRKSKAAKYVLGISCFYHNSAACLIRDGEIAAAAEEERFTRVKNDRRFPQQAANYCLEEEGINASDLSAVVYYDNAALTFERILHSQLALGEKAEDSWLRIMPTWLRFKLHIPQMIRQHLGYDGKILQDLHHRSHAASAFYPSPFERAAILTIDGVGEWSTAAIGTGNGKEVKLLHEMRFPHSLGLLYSAFTQFTGFRVNSGEYKMMGLAPYGEPRYVDQILNHLVDLKEDGSVELNLDYFGFLYQPSMTSDRFGELFGGPGRKPDSRITRREMDIARSIQVVTEEAVLRMARHVHRLTGETKLCLAGGVALNCVANGRLLREGPFEDIWIQPAAGDSGCALGAALDVYHTYFGEARKKPGPRPLQGGSYLGPSFSDDEVKAYLDTFGFPYRRLEDADRNTFLAKRLEEGKVVGHMAGRLEFGPRSLGARSILGDPRNQTMQSDLNLKIKYRESFRPFAPTVLAERVSEYFELDRESPYMLVVAPVRKEIRLETPHLEGEDLLPVVRQVRSTLPAITHADYSARIQTLRREDHPVYYDLIQAFARETGCGVLVNTSFNVRGEPIICTPADAYRCFMRTEMNVLALGNYILLKEEQPPWPEGNATDLESEDASKAEQNEHPEAVLAVLKEFFHRRFLPIAKILRAEKAVLVDLEFTRAPSMWHPLAAAAFTAGPCEYPSAMDQESPDAAQFCAALAEFWTPGAATEALKPLVTELLTEGIAHRVTESLEEEVSEAVYVMF